MLRLLLLTIVALLAVNAGAKQILSLPGYHHKIPFEQHSGYLDGGNERQMFYWLTGAQHNASEAPLVLWLNGGPGCSSLEGLFTENGPWRVNPGGKTVKLDEFAWNKNAHVLYLESPVNVGFSYNTSDLGAANQVHNDNTTVATKYHALLDFFHKFPEMKAKKFYITGESYAGVYIPLLVAKILDNKQENGINLKGAAIGNGVFDMEILAQSRIDYAFSHAMIGYDHQKSLEALCCKNPASRQCDYPLIYSSFTVKPRNDNKQCAQAVGAALAGMFSFDLYYVVTPCNKTEQKHHITHECYSPSYGDYLNMPEVRKAIHVDTAIEDRKWEECNSDVLYRDYVPIYESMEATIRHIVETHHFNNIILYNGDADIVCDFLQTQRFLFDRMQYNLTEPSAIWQVGGKTAGLEYKFVNGLTYYTVNGAGHYVPAHKPRQALEILSKLISK